MKRLLIVLDFAVVIAAFWLNVTQLKEGDELASAFCILAALSAALHEWEQE